MSVCLSIRPYAVFWMLIHNMGFLFFQQLLSLTKTSFMKKINFSQRSVAGHVGRAVSLDNSTKPAIISISPPRSEWKWICLLDINYTDHKYTNTHKHCAVLCCVLLIRVACVSLSALSLLSVGVMRCEVMQPVVYKQTCGLTGWRSRCLCFAFHRSWRTLTQGERSRRGVFEKMQISGE